MVAVSKHFRLLDGLRGVAAIAVVAYHFGDRTDLPWLLPRGYLAVDFFFILSGFVLAYAYGARLGPEQLAGALTFPQFALHRLIRLLPMLVPGTLLAAMMEYWRPGFSHSLAHLWQVGFLTLLGSLALPWPFPTPLEQAIFPLNGPVWSLFFELAANGAFGLAVLSVGLRRSAWLLMTIGAVGLIGCGVVLGKVNVGAILADWPGGLPRVLFGFFAGVLVFVHRRQFPALPAWATPAILLAIMLVPRLHGPWDVVFDLGAVLIAFPLLVGAASHGVVTGPWLRGCTAAGDLSYPLYAIHYPIVRAVGFVVLRAGLPPGARAAAGAGVVGLALLLSWLAFRLYDQPVRHALTRALQRRPQRAVQKDVMRHPVYVRKRQG